MIFFNVASSNARLALKRSNVSLLISDSTDQQDGCKERSSEYTEHERFFIHEPSPVRRCVYPLGAACLPDPTAGHPND